MAALKLTMRQSLSLSPSLSQNEANSNLYSSCNKDAASSHSIPEMSSSRAHRQVKKRPREGSNEDLYPLKRRPGIWNPKYVTVLNADIESASLRQIPPAETDPRLGTSKFGMTIWTEDEKEHFFSLLSRLGRDDIEGIAQGLGSKTELEVRQYCSLLEQAKLLRRNMKGRRPLKTVHIFDIPAAAEISEKVDRILEGTADALAERQERHEEKAEKKRWGKWWNITPETAMILSSHSKKHQDRDKPQEMNGVNSTTSSELATVPDSLRQLVTFFNVPSILRLSRCIFMNGGMDSENNWRLVGDIPPSIRTTALEDFHNIASIITKRLIAAAMYLARQRIRIKNEADHNQRKPLVRAEDIRAAASSLGLQPNSTKFWRGAPRRLQLNISRHEPDPASKAHEQLMDYDSVEEDLTILQENHVHVWDRNNAVTEKEFSGPSKSHAFVTSPISEGPLEKDEDGDSDGTDLNVCDTEDEILDEPENFEERAFEAEIDELMDINALNGRTDTRLKQSIRKRVKAERERDTQADEMDIEKSQAEEKFLLGLLGPKRKEEKATTDGDSKKKGENENGRRDRYLTGIEEDWRDSVNYESEWEQKLHWKRHRSLI